MKMKRIVILLLTVLLISSCSHDTDGGEGTSETITSSSDTTSDEKQTPPDTDTDVTTGELQLQLPPVESVEDLITPDPNRNPLASSDVLRTIVEGTSLDDLITTAGLPQRIEKMKVYVSFSETTSAAVRLELPCLSYDTSEGITYIFTVRTYTYEGAPNWTREVYSVEVKALESTGKA